MRGIDLAHVLAYVAAVGRAPHGPETRAFQRWYVRMSQQLGRQLPQRMVSELWLLYRQHADRPEGEAIELAIRYLEKRLPMTDYTHFRRQQIPIRSGSVALKKGGTVDD